MSQTPLLPPNTVLPEIVGDFPCIVVYVDVAQEKVLECRWSKFSEVMPTVAAMHEQNKETGAEPNGKK